jgi:hypothetical protein
MQALPLPSKPFESISMDFITDLPPSIVLGQTIAADSILVIVDRYTEAVRYIPCRKTINAPDLAQLFFHHWTTVYQRLLSLTEDPCSPGNSGQPSASTSECEGTYPPPSTPRRMARRNDKTKVLKSSCACSATSTRTTGQSSYRSRNSAIITPATSPLAYRPTWLGTALTSRPNQDSRASPQEGEVPAAADRIQQIKDIRIKLEQTWIHTKGLQVKYYNKRRTPLQFHEQEKVWLSAKNIRTAQPSKKLGHRWLGPFRIQKRIGKQAYQLELPQRYKDIHNVFVGGFCV